MPIIVTLPSDGVDAVKGDLRSNLVAIRDGIQTLDSAISAATTISSANFGDHTFMRVRSTSASAVTVTLANSVLAGCALEVVQYAAGVVTVAAGSGATLVKPASASFSTSAQYDALVVEVDTNSGSNAAWRLVART